MVIQDNINMAPAQLIYEYELIDIEFEHPYKQNDFACEDSPVIEYDVDGVPMGNSLAEIDLRRKIVHEYIQQWRNSHEDKRLFNEDLADYIRINQLFLLESVNHAVDNYYSTKAVLRMEEVMAKAMYIGDSQKKEGNSNQKSFEKMVVLIYRSEDLGNVKMTVGIMRRTHEKIGYSITVPASHTPFIEEDLKIGANKKKRKKHHK